MVTKTSKALAANSSSSPFVFPAQPACGTVVTAWSGMREASCRGKHSSSSTRIAEQSLLGKSQRCDGLIPCDSREISQELNQGLTGLQVLKECSKRHSRASEHGSTAENVGRTLDDRVRGAHGSIVGRLQVLLMPGIEVRPACLTNGAKLRAHGWSATAMIGSRGGSA